MGAGARKEPGENRFDSAVGCGYRAQTGDRRGAQEKADDREAWIGVADGGAADGEFLGKAARASFDLLFQTGLSVCAGGKSQIQSRSRGGGMHSLKARGIRGDRRICRAA